VRIFSLAPKLSGLRRCILSPILNFHDYFFFGGGTSSQLWCALARLGQSVTRRKIWGGSTSKGRNVICNISIRSGDIRDRSRKLSKIAPNFGRFFALQNFRGPAFQVIPMLSWYVAWKWFCKDTPISPEVLVAHTLNFKPNFKFSRLKFLGTPSQFCNVR